MWLARQQKRAAAEAVSGVGEVTLGGDAPAVELDSERRELTVYGPGGYRWRPVEGQKVLVLKADGDYCVAGAESEGGLEPGEVELDSGGGAFVRLDKWGRVILHQNALVEGQLYVGGKELTQLIREVAAEVLAELLGG